MDFSKIKRFKVNEFPSLKEVKLTDSKVFYTLDIYAQNLGNNIPVYPSPVKGALARTTGRTTSRHYAINRLSTAVDFFVGCFPLKAFLIAQIYFGGIGVYFDTHFKGRSWVMLHGDLRKPLVIWRRDNSVYHTITTWKDYNKLLIDLKEIEWKNHKI